MKNTQLTQEEIGEILSYKEHFENLENSLELAAAAHVFGLGVVKMKKGKPAHATLNQHRRVHQVIRQVEEAAEAAAIENA
ncbi:MAG TPA: hypothetical protein VGB00_19365 [Pyrinomonadaceae bacterium]|jgi:hypothetical protein